MTSKTLFITLLLALALALAVVACGGSESASTQPAAAAQAEPAHGGEGDHEEGALKLTAAQIEAAGIEIASAGPATIRETLPLYGVVAPNAERVREVGARFPGVIRSVARKIGDTVKQGETLATVESNESLQTYPVLASLAGVIAARNANPGEQTGDKSLFTIADLSSVWVELSLFPRDVAKVRVGQKVRVKSADAGLSTDGELVYVAPFGSSANQTLTARVLVDNADRHWAPGLYVTADVTLAETTVALSIRNESVQNLEGRSVVFVRDADGFEPRPVKLGRVDDENSEVLEGLEVGDAYVTRNSYILKAELGKGEAEHGH
ncbi:efflux RND transporter periplasmic adaptor subunit [Hydrocarboniphaga sp.]|uniref:efflux RND transporter periplasmic adaptor subunit n=1 Tax=Hydrocarboniphaga sp. TaxID=2033016 RepID=UPI003D1343B2